MPGRSIGTTLVVAGLVAALAGPRVLPLRSPQPFAPADSTEAVPDTWMADVTMEPIRVVIPRDWRMEAVTMEPIRVVIPLAGSPTTESRGDSPRR